MLRECTNGALTNKSGFSFSNVDRTSSISEIDERQQSSTTSGGSILTFCIRSVHDRVLVFQVLHNPSDEPFRAFRRGVDGNELDGFI